VRKEVERRRFRDRSRQRLTTPRTEDVVDLDVRFAQIDERVERPERSAELLELIERLPQAMSRVSWRAIGPE